MLMNVLESARNRIRFVFSEFERIVVSYSGGKDSTCLFHLAVEEAERTGRKFELFFLDQEAEYLSTIDMVVQCMNHPLVIPKWYQVPIMMTNATSHEELFLHAWENGKKWIRDKDPLGIHAIDSVYPDRFYKFFEWFEKLDCVPTAHLVGLRIFESMSRQRTMLKENGYKHYKWSTACGNGSYRFYPIFDFQFKDIWKYIADGDFPYNATYDRMIAKSGVNIRTMRVSNLIHEQAFRSLASLQEFEPDTYGKLVERLGGVHCAAMYADDEFIYKANKLPPSHKTWRTYRDHLLDTTPSDVTARFAARFVKQGNDERVCQHQVKQMLLNDWEGKLPMTAKKASELRNNWWDRI